MKIIINPELNKIREQQRRAIKREIAQHSNDRTEAWKPKHNGNVPEEPSEYALIGFHPSYNFKKELGEK